MDARIFLESLLAASTAAQAEQAIQDFEDAHDEAAAWVPVGGKDNNRGPIEVSADPGRSLVERVTNGIDAVLEAEHDRHAGIPECRSPREASVAWLGVPAGGLSEMTARQRQQLANRVTVRLLTGDGREARLMEVRDAGIGLAPEDLPTTILSLNESNKIQKHYLAGTYGQGGSSTFAISKFTLIASRRPDREVAFTVVKFLDLPPDLFKTGHYVYLTLEESVLTADLDEDTFAPGTLAKHFGYDLSPYPSPLGPNSVYGLLNQVLFDPVLPVWLESELHGYRRVIKGSRNALNGAVDEGDPDRRGPTLAHHVPLFYVTIADYGSVAFEYWVLERPTTANKRPNAAFVNPNKPIIMTLNGQNHAELSSWIVRKEAELPYLTPRFIAHIDCNSLTPAARRALFASTREEARVGAVYQQIRDELLRILRSDDELTRLNNEARQDRSQERDEAAVQQMRREVAQLLRLHGLDVGQATGGQAGAGTGTEPTGRRRRPGPPPEPLEAHEPPTYLRIVWEDNEAIPFYPGQRRYIRLETDAASTYHNADNAVPSRINLIAAGGRIVVRGSTPLRGGRMRVIVDCPTDAQIGTGGAFRVELTRPGLPLLEAERSLSVVAPPEPRPGPSRLTLPPFEVIPVAGPHEGQWADLNWPDDIEQVASSAEMEEGVLTVYYSEAFPKYARQRGRYEQRHPSLAESYTTRYKVWLAAHSLLLYGDEQETPSEEAEDQDQEAAEVRERQERRRLATIASLMAAREAESGDAATEVDTGPT